MKRIKDDKVFALMSEMEKWRSEVQVNATFVSFVFYPIASLFVFLQFTCRP